MKRLILTLIGSALGALCAQAALPAQAADLPIAGSASYEVRLHSMK